MRYYSEREFGETPRESDEIAPNVWRGLLVVIRNRVADGSFGARYPSICDDGPLCYGTDVVMFEHAMRAEIPRFASFVDHNYTQYGRTVLDVLEVQDTQPPTLEILDFIEFCWKCVGKPTRTDFHSFFQHHHLSLDEDAGRDEFRGEIEMIFRRNGVGYKLTEHGRMERLVPPVLHGTLVQPESNSGDAELDRLLESAQRKFLYPNPEPRREALEALWDAWERLKTLDGQGDKKTQTRAMLDMTAGKASPMFKDALDKEALELTRIGNSLRIRHSETNQEILATNAHVDYLFFRLFSLLRLILESRKPTEV